MAVPSLFTAHDRFFLPKIDMDCHPLNSAVAELPPVGLAVLLVDDHVDTHVIFSVLLAPEGVTESTASSGQPALSPAATQYSETTLGDIGMPLLDGFQSVARLRQSGSNVSLLGKVQTGYAIRRTTAPGI